ncbi:MAG: DUF2142 domain-containing protein [Chloroflexi bacterium]|nr:DUF2142 domain-containing protein [Chloroflexota bacterium]
MRRSGPAGAHHGAPLLALISSPLAAIVLAFVALALGYALATPAWNNPDEPAHYNYVRQVAAGALPELRPGDWDAVRLDYLKTYRFPPGESIADLRYESHQPPLYYLLAAPLLLASEPFGQRASVLALRALSIVLGALVVLVTYRVAQAAVFPPGGSGGSGAARHAVPPPTPRAEEGPGARGGAATQERGRYWESPASWAVPLLAAGLVAFVPMHTAMSAAVNNDALANLLSGVLVLALLWGMGRGFSARAALAVGLLGGALGLTKVTTYGLVPLALAVVALVRLRQDGGPARPGAWLSAGRAIGLAALALVLVGGWWLVRQGLVYGWDDLLASRRHELVVVGEPRWSDLAVEPVSYFASTLFQSFWAQFGWMAILVDERLYRLFGLFGVLALFGLSLRLRATTRALLLPSSPASLALLKGEGARLLLLGAVCVVVFAEVAYYNLTFVQPQGRYLYPALAALATLLALGWDSLVAHGRVGRGLAAAWLVAAALDGTSLLLGAQLSVRVVYATALVAGALVATRPTGSRVESAARPALALGAVLALGLLDLVCLVRAVGAGFAG